MADSSQELDCSKTLHTLSAPCITFNYTVALMFLLLYKVTKIPVRPASAFFSSTHRLVRSSLKISPACFPIIRFHFTAALSAIAILLLGADARIVGFKVPKTIKPGDKFGAVVKCESIAGTNQPADEDRYATFGYAPIASAVQGTLGTFLTQISWLDGTYVYNPLIYIIIVYLLIRI